MDARIVDLRYRMKEVLGAIDRGETVTVLHRGKAKAKLTPIGPAPDDARPRTKDQPLFGMWKSREDLRDPASYVRSVRRPRHSPTDTASAKPAAGRKAK